MRLAAAALGLALAAPATSAETLRIGTWNMEWMMRPEAFDRLAPSCFGRDSRAGHGTRAIPCDLAPKGRWSEADLARIRAFALTLDADVIALQEVDGRNVAAALFPGHEFCFTRRRGVQNVGFAIRKGLRHRCNRDHRALGLPDNEVRWGVDLTVDPGAPGEFRLLGVHLKSSCHRDPLTSTRPDCRVLQRQVPELETWIDRRARSGEAFGVVGDFNRRLDREREAARDADGAIAALWPEIDDGEPAGADLVDPGVGRGAAACGNGHGKRMPIDYLILGQRLAHRLVPDSYRVWDYPAGGRWPDHCVISIELER